MAKGLIWGEWDSLHDGQVAALTQAFSECTYVYVIMLNSSTIKAGMKAFEIRTEKLKKWIKSAGYKNQRYIFIEQPDVETAAVYAATNLDYDVMYLVDYEVYRDCPSDIKLDMDAIRLAAGKAFAPFVPIPAVLNVNDEPIRDTKYRKRVAQGWDVTGYYSKKVP